MAHQEKPAAVVAFEIQRETRNTLSYEKEQFDKLFRAVYGQGLQRAIDVFEAMPTNGPLNRPAVSAAQMFAVSAIQAVTHNVSLTIMDKPEALANPKIQNLLGALAELRDDPTITSYVNDRVPFQVTLNPDGTATLAELPDPEEPEE